MELGVLNIDGPLIKLNVTDGRRLILHNTIYSYMFELLVILETYFMCPSNQRGITLPSPSVSYPCPFVGFETSLMGGFVLLQTGMLNMLL